MAILLIFSLIAGFLGGILQGMLGVGTGILVVPLLTFMLPRYGFSPAFAIHIAIATSMAAIIFSSISSLVSHHKRENIQWDVFKRIIAFSMLGSLLGALLASYLPAHILKIIFAVFMFIVALNMFFKKQAHDEKASAPKISSERLTFGGLAIGITASLVGIGGGLFMVPFLHWQKVKMRYAVGTSTAVGLPVVLLGTLTYVITGIMHNGISATTIGYVHWPALLAIALAGIVSAPLGARLATHLPTLLLQRLFAVCIVIMGIKMLF